MTKQKKLEKIKELYKSHSRKFGYNALCKKYKLAREFVRYHLEEGYRERILKNALKWQTEHKEKRNEYMKKYLKKRNENKLLSQSC